MKDSMSTEVRYVRINNVLVPILPNGRPMTLIYPNLNMGRRVVRTA